MKEDIKLGTYTKESTVNKQEYAYRYIKDKILKNIYKPQQPLTESSLRAELKNISRTPIREALNRLMSEGLVDGAPGKEKFVAQIQFNEVLNIMEVRSILQTEAVDLFVKRASDAEIDELGRLLEAHKEAWNAGKHLEAVTLDHKFHLKIAEGTRNRYLYDLIKRYIQLISRASFLTAGDSKRVQKSVEEHIAIFEAIEKRDVQAATILQKSHFEGLSLYLLQREFNYDV